MRRGGAFGIGSDSNVLIGVTDELRQLEYSQRLAHRARNVVAGTHRLRPAVRCSKARSRADRRRSVSTASGLTEGAFADIVSLDAENVALAGRSGDAILDSWIFGAGRSLVDCVWARGRKVVKDGRHHSRETIAQRFRQTLEGLLAA